MIIRTCAILALVAVLGGCSGFSEQAITIGDTGLDRLKEAADVVEASRCNLRTVGVLNRMAAERGPAWTEAYFASCGLGDLKQAIAPK